MGDTRATIGMVPGSVSVGGTEENRPVMTYIRIVLFFAVVHLSQAHLGRL